MKIVKSALLAACALAGLAVVSPSSAATLVTAGGIYSYNTLNIAGHGTGLATALDLTVQGSSDPLWVFCVDLDHNIYVAIGSQLPYSPPLSYAASPVLTDSTGALSGTGNLLTPPISGEIATLAMLGVGIAQANGPGGIWASQTIQNELTAIQGAIWDLEYGASTITGGHDNSAGDGGFSLIGGYLAYAAANPQPGNAPGFYPTGPDGQGFGTTQGFVTAGVPEPAIWTMLLLGFFGTGFMLRRSRSASAIG